MKKKKVYLMLPIFLVSFMMGCSNDSKEFAQLREIEKNIDVSEINLKININNGRLVFKSQSDFDAVLKALEEYENANVVSNLRFATQVGGSHSEARLYT